MRPWTEIYTKQEHISCTVIYQFPLFSEHQWHTLYAQKVQRQCLQSHEWEMADQDLT